MALTSSDVYSPQNPGLASVLGSGLSPLHIIQQEAQRQSRERFALIKANAIDNKTKAAAEKVPTLPLPDMKGAEYFQDELNQSLKQTYADQLEDYKTKPPVDAKFSSLSRVAGHNGKAAMMREKGAEIDKLKATAAASNLDPAKVQEGLSKLLTDPETGQRIAADKFDSAALAGFHDNADYLDERKVVQTFLQGLAQRQESEYTTAARPGRPGMAYSAASNIFANDGRGKTLYAMDARGNRVPQIANIQALEQAALQDPQMAALLRRRLETGQLPTASLLMGLGPEHVTDDQLEALNAQTDQNTPHERQTLADLLRPYGTLVEKQRELSPQAVRQPRASAALKASQATATPTSGFGLSVSENAQPWMEAVPNPKKAGLLNFLTPNILKSGTRAVPTNNHYPHLGVSFASEKAPSVPLLVDTNDLRVLGADGTPTKHNSNKVNSKAKMSATDRSFVLEINGKRMGLPKAGSSADAYQELGAMIDKLTPEQARKAVLASYYQGAVTDKAAVSGDGSGGTAKVIGYKDAFGQWLSAGEVAEAQKRRDVLIPVYDKAEVQSSVMVPATATLDAQVARQTPGYNPRQRTAQEADLIRRLEAKGGRVVDPYHTTQEAPIRPSFLQPKKAAADKSGGMFASPSTATSSTGAGPLASRMAQQEGKLRNGKTDPLGFGTSSTRGGNIQKAPKKPW